MDENNGYIYRYPERTNPDDEYTKLFIKKDFTDSESGIWYDAPKELKPLDFLGYPIEFDSHKYDIEDIRVNYPTDLKDLNVKYIDVFEVFERLLGSENPMIEPLILTYSGKCSTYIKSYEARRFYTEFLTPTISDQLTINYSDWKWLIAPCRKREGGLGFIRQLGRQNYVWNVTINKKITKKDWSNFLIERSKSNSSTKSGQLFLWSDTTGSDYIIRDIDFFLPIPKEYMLNQYRRILDEDCRIIRDFYYSVNKAKHKFSFSKGIEDAASKAITTINDEFKNTDKPVKIITEDEILRIASSLAQVKGFEKVKKTQIADASDIILKIHSFFYKNKSNIQVRNKYQIAELIEDLLRKEGALTVEQILKGLNQYEISEMLVFEMIKQLALENLIFFDKRRRYQIVQ